MADTYFQAVLNSAREAVNNEPGATQLKGLNKQQVVDTVAALTNALDSIDPAINLHIVFFALTYVKNAVVLAMEENQRVLATQTGGSA